jgi:hypothetical protein
MRFRCESVMQERLVHCANAESTLGPSDDWRHSISITALVLACLAIAHSRYLTLRRSPDSVPHVAMGYASSGDGEVAPSQTAVVVSRCGPKVDP